MNLKYRRFCFQYSLFLMIFRFTFVLYLYNSISWDMSHWKLSTDVSTWPFICKNAPNIRVSSLTRLSNSYGLLTPILTTTQWNILQTNFCSLCDFTQKIRGILNQYISYLFKTSFEPQGVHNKLVFFSYILYFLEN